MTTSATTTNAEREKRITAQKPTKLMSKMANICIKGMGEYWSLNVESKLMSDGTTHHEFHFVLNEEKRLIITNNDLKQITSFATMVGAFGWYISKDYYTNQMTFTVSVSTD